MFMFVILHLQIMLILVKQRRPGCSVELDLIAELMAYCF